MGLTLKNAMKLGKFGECEVVAGHKGLSRIIENVTIMEVPEVVRWLKDKELILTSLYALKDDIDAQNTLVQKLDTARATALAIKPSQFIKNIPQGIINSANKLNFPIIVIPDHVKYLDILSPVMRHIFNEKVVLQEDVDHATAILHEISLNDQGIDEFAINLEHLTKNMITIESEFSFISASKPEEKIVSLDLDKIYNLSVIQRPLQINREYESEVISCIVAPIMVDGEYYGNITCWGINHDHMSIDLAILEKASTLLALEFLKLKVKHDIEQQYENDFIRELLYSQNIREKSVIEWGEHYRITTDATYVCLLFSGRERKSSNKHLERLKDYKINSIIKKIRPDALVGYIHNDICVILSTNKKSSGMYQNFFNEIQGYIGSNYILSLGVGRMETGPLGIQKSFLQAEQALHLSETIRDSKEIVFYDKLGAYLLINQLRENKELYNFYDGTIGKLLYEDKNNELLHTLKTYFYYDEVLKVASNSLHIHVNTLKYRLKKIEKVTGCSLNNSEGKMNLFLGLKIHELINHD